MAKPHSSNRPSRHDKSSPTPLAPERDGTLEPDQPRAFKLVMAMMAIPGRSGQEAEVARYVIEQLLAAGALAEAIETDEAHRKSPIKGQIGNLIFKLPGTVRGPRRLLMAHLDTVPICIGARPVLKGKRVHSADRATGLGGDDRAGAAVVLNTALEILQHKLPHPPLTFLWPVQEEIGLCGARYVRVGMLGKPRLAFNWDGGAPEKVTIGATGDYRIRVEIAGRASHAGGAPEEGISAIAIASLAIADLVAEGWHGLVRKGKSRGTSNVGVIHGGEATNVVTDYVEVRAEARSHDPKFRVRILRAIERAFVSAARRVRSVRGARGKIRFESELAYESFRLPASEPCIAVAEAAVRAAGLEPFLAISNGGLDANWMVAHGIPTVTLGCGQMNIHTVDEQLDVDAFQDACRIALRLATDVR